MAKKTKPFKSLSIAVLTISNRHTPDTDESGHLIHQLLTEAGHCVSYREIVRSNLYTIRAIVSQLIADPASQVIILNGGTGFAPDNCTEEALLPLLDKKVEGFGELFRCLSYQQIGSSSMQSRALSGLANQTLLFAIPGSPSACSLAMVALILPQLDARQGPCNFVGQLCDLTSGCRKGSENEEGIL